MKTKEELNELKEEVEALNKKLSELTDDELEQVASGDAPDILQFLSDGDALNRLDPHRRRRPEQARKNPGRLRY